MGTLPSIGSIVKVTNWIGVVINIAQCENGELMLLVNSPKAYRHGHNPEWIVYDKTLVSKATNEELEYDAQENTRKLMRRIEMIEGLVSGSCNNAFSTTGNTKLDAIER